MKAVMISIRKEHDEKIFSGIKKWEGRKTIPDIVKVWNHLRNDCDYQPSSTDVTFYIYEPKSGGGCGKVIGEFVCDFAQSFSTDRAIWSRIAKALCVDIDFVRKYFNKEYGYMIRVCNPVKYDKPKELSEFWRPCPFKTEDQDNDCIQCDAAADSDTGFVCTNRVWKAPQSWCYVEEL